MGGAVVLLMPYGAIGIVGANILKMVCRIAGCAIAYIDPVFRQAGGSLLETRPSLPVLGGFGLATLLTQVSLTYIYAATAAPKFWLFAAQHVLVGAFGLAALGVVMWRQEGRKLLRDMRELRSL